MSDENKFAKLFERDGEQVLVMKDTNDDGEPCVGFTCNLDEIMVTPKLGFKPTAKGFTERDRLFNDCDEEMAFGMRAKMVAEFGQVGQSDEGQEPKFHAAAKPLKTGR